MEAAVAKMSKQDLEWQAQSDLNTLIDAAKIRKDPKRLAAVVARKKMLEEAMDKVG